LLDPGPEKIISDPDPGSFGIRNEWQADKILKLSQNAQYKNITFIFFNPLKRLKLKKTSYKFYKNLYLVVILEVCHTTL
jgi:hypothetical protein